MRTVNTYYPNKIDVEKLRQEEFEKNVQRAVEIVKNHNLVVNKKLTYLKNVNITEYDLKDAGLSIIKYKELLSDKIIEELSSISKEKRNIKIGKLKAMKRYRYLIETENKELIRLRQEFVKTNGLCAENILSIKKDAIFIIKKSPINLIFDDGSYEFRAKETYTSYFYVDKKEIFTDGKDLAVKGFTKEVSKNKDTNLLNEIKNIMILAEKVSKTELYDYLNNFRRNYLAKKCDIEYYRRLDTGMFRINNLGYDMEELIDDSLLKDLDITYNYRTYIKPLIKEVLK